MNKKVNIFLFKNEKNEKNEDGLLSIIRAESKSRAKEILNKMLSAEATVFYLEDAYYKRCKSRDHLSSCEFCNMEKMQVDEKKFTIDLTCLDCGAIYTYGLNEDHALTLDDRGFGEMEWYIKTY